MTVEIEDGSVWKINPSYATDVLTWWRPSDPITISPSSFPGWTGARFYLTNQRTKTYAYADIFLGPFADNPNTLRIIDIDYYSSTICLQNGQGQRSCWKIDPSDSYTMRKWLVGETIIIGVNQGAYAGIFSSYDNILLNVDRNFYIRAGEY